jgi:DNA gyrase/topoisomerase IV subunit B
MSADSIQVLKGLEHVQKAPMYIGDVSTGIAPPI